MEKQTQRPRIVVTGIGIHTPIGNTVEAFRENLKNGVTGIKRHSGIFENRDAWAAIVEDFHPEQHFNSEELEAFDRTALMGILAARQAIRDSKVDATQRNALIFGTSHGGRSQLDRFVESGNDIDNTGAAERILEKSAHYHQTAAIGSKLGIHGPCVTLSNACSSSGAAIGYGIELLRSGQCDWVLAGGADGFSKLTYAGFEALGAMADGPSAPFSEPVGMSLGDGAGFLILETIESAKKRGATIYAELYGWGLSWDAYHITAPEPSGEGMLRAIEMAVSDAGIQKDQIDYINIHGTGTRANDAAEAVALTRYFADSTSGKVPPLSATKSLTGHMLGASSALGVIASIVGMNESWLPPTANFTTIRPGCELDAVPNKARPASIRFFLAQSAAFAGANAVIIGGIPDQSFQEPASLDDDIMVSGIGVITPIGFDLNTFQESIKSHRSGIAKSESIAGLGVDGELCGAITDYQPRKLMPSLNLRRVDRVASFATIATSLALKDAGLWPLKDAGVRTGLVVAITRGAATSYEKYLESVKGERWQDASAVFFPNLVMSSVGGQVSSTLGIRGITSSLVGGGNAGLQALVHAVELFRRNPLQDTLVVVASDELASLYFKLHTHRRNACKSTLDKKCILGEGSVAIVLEKRTSLAARAGNSYGRIAGYAMTHDGGLPSGERSNPAWMHAAALNALKHAGVSTSEINHVQLLASGRSDTDARESQIVEHSFSKCRPASITSQTGFAEASSSLANLVSLLLQLPRDTNGASLAEGESTSRGIILAGSDDGGNIAVVVDNEGKRPCDS